MAIVRRWIEVASIDEIVDAINVLSPVGTALCMAAAAKKDHEKGELRKICPHYCNIVHYRQTAYMGTHLTW